MHMHPTPLAIALAIILSTSSHVIAAPHRQHRSLIDRSPGHHGLDSLHEEQADQRYEHGPMHTATPPTLKLPPSAVPSVATVTAAAVKTVTVFPTPVKAPSATFGIPSPLPGIPIPEGTKRPVTLSPSTTSTSTTSTSTTSTSTTSKTTVTKSTTSTASSANKAATASSTVVSFSSSIIVAALPSSSLTITVTIPTSVAIPSSITVPSVTIPSIADISSSAAAEALSALSASLATATATATTTTTTSDSSDSDSDATATTTSTSSTTSSTTTSSTCSGGTTRKCCSAVHDLKKGNIFDVIDEVIPGFSLNFLQLDTSIGLDCVDIDDEDDTNTDGDVCWDVVSCCDNTSLGSIFLGCVPVIL